MAKNKTRIGEVTQFTIDNYLVIVTKEEDGIVTDIYNEAGELMDSNQVWFEDLK